MNYKPYTFRSDEESTSFHFQSVGKRGIFDKLILIRPLLEEHYNLALLDYDLDTQEYSDISVTDNGDMPEVLATVMKAILLFLDKYPERKVNFQGSTGSRTRLYQIAINQIYPEIKKDLTIYGWINNAWVPFEPNLSFESFLIGKRTIT